MFGLVEICLLTASAAFLACALVPWLRPYRSLSLGASALLLISVLIPRRGNGLGQYLFGASSGAPRLPIELFGIAWWVLGAWLVKSALDLLLRKTIFPDDNEPHARRLFADLAAALVYVVALVGIMDTVLKQPISAVLATSGVMAIVLGLALQNTLADVFAGLAINIERPFGAGDWISVGADVEGQAMEINWRATRIKTIANEMIVIPNSIVAKAMVTNHRRLKVPQVRSIRLRIDHKIPPSRAIDILQKAAAGCPGLSHGALPVARACEFADALVGYELVYSLDDWTQRDSVRSTLISSVADALLDAGIDLGTPPLDVRFLPLASGAVARGAALPQPPAIAGSPATSPA